MTELSISYDAPPTVGRFMGSDAFVRAILGPFGSGKSSGCVMELFRRACEQAPGPDGVRRSRWGIIRNTYSQLKDTTRKTFEQWIPAQLGAWKESEFKFVAKFSDVEAEFMFRALDRPEDVRKLLSSEFTGAWLNEAREIPKAVFDAIQGRVGRYPSKIQGGPSWFGVMLDSNPWAMNHWGHDTFTKRKNIAPEDNYLYELFNQPSGLAQDAENVENLPPNYYRRLAAGKDTEWVDCYVHGLCPRSDKGSIWGAEIALLEERGGVCEFEHPTDGVFTVWDLGISDSTAIWFFRLRGGLIDVIDHYEEHGRALAHFCEVLNKKGYSYIKHWLPHDARARSLQTGISIVELLVKWCSGNPSRGMPAVVPQLSLVDGIGAARWLLEQDIRIHSRCQLGIDALKAYRYEFSEKTQDYSRTPVHDWSSHSADGFRYCACVVNSSDILTRKPAKPEPFKGNVCVPAAQAYTLDQLFEARKKGYL